MATYDNEYTSKGVGNAGLSLGIIGTTLASGILGNGSGLGGLFNGGSNPNSMQNTLAEKNAYIAKLEAEKYSDDKVKELYSFQVAQGEKLNTYLQGLDKRLAAVETAAPLREQIVLGKVQEVANSVACVNINLQTQLASISTVLSGITKCVVPNSAICPGWGNVTIAPAAAPANA